MQSNPQQHIFAASAGPDACVQATITVTRSAITTELHGTSFALLPATKWALNDNLPTVVNQDLNPAPQPLPTTQYPVMCDLDLNPSTHPEGVSCSLKLDIRGQDDLQQMAEAPVRIMGIALTLYVSKCFHHLLSHDFICCHLLVMLCNIVLYSMNLYFNV